MLARRADVVALRRERIGFARSDERAGLAVVVQNDDLCAAAAAYVVVPLVPVRGATPDYPGWGVIDNPPGLDGTWIAAADEVSRIAAHSIEPGVRARLSGPAMARVDTALRWVLDV